MPSIRDYKTYGAIMSAIGGHVESAMREAHKGYYGTPQYFTRRQSMVHEAFEDFCKGHGLAPSQTAGLRMMIQEHGPKHLMTAGMRILCNELPDAFNVRGQWVSPRATVIAAVA